MSWFDCKGPDYLKTATTLQNYAREKYPLLPRTQYFSSFYLGDLVKIFLFKRIEKILITFQFNEAMVSGSGFHY